MIPYFITESKRIKNKNKFFKNAKKRGLNVKINSEKTTKN